MKNSYLTVTDQFCGAGGSSSGAMAAGVEVKMALNHWQLAVNTHNTNFPNASHDCTDISASNPRRYPSTDILITSPECTNHSLAKGKSRQGQWQPDLFGKVVLDPAEERSRATMWDVPRFAEYHQYRIIIVENVVDARQWVMWDAWLHAMDSLGYDHKCVYFNSMFAYPTPQSRDRMYVVFWKKGNRAPNLEFHPPAHCTRCERNVEAVQAWKNNRSAGRYKKQYVYVCPNCHATVEPYYYCAFNAIDWAIPAPRIGDRPKPLKEKTLKRIQAGLDKFGAQPILADTIHSARNGRDGDMVWPATAANRTQIGQPTHGLITPPLVVDLAHNKAQNSRCYPVTDTMPTQTSYQTMGMVVPPFMVEMFGQSTVRAMTEPTSTMMGIEHHGVVVTPFVLSLNHTTDRLLGAREALPTVMPQTIPSLVVPPPYLIDLRGENAPRAMLDALSTVCASGNHHGVVMPFLASYYGTDNLAPVDRAVPTVTTNDRHGLVVPPFLLSYYTRESGQGAALAGIHESVPTQPTWPVHYLAQPGQKHTVEECGFRMLQPHEIQKAMAFNADYIVLGNSREKVKQLGNAVTPPVMAMIVKRCVESLEAA